MDELIQQAFAHVSVVGPAVRAGRFDLIGPNGEMILKAVWENMIEEDWTITMTMWPEPERPQMPHALPNRPRSRHEHGHGSSSRVPPPPQGRNSGPGPGPSFGRVPPPPPHGQMYGEMRRNPDIISVPPRDRSSRSPSRTKSKKSSSGGGMLGFLAGGKPKSSSSGKGVLNFFSWMLT